MKKFFIFIMVILVLFSSGCDALLEALEEYAEESNDEVVLQTAEPKDSTSANTNSSQDINALYDGMPSLPDLDYENLDLFEDGYQIVEFDHAPDGDTAIFVVGSSYLKTRFLGVDTTEMSTDSGTPEDWAQQGKEFTNDMLENADEIILELDHVAGNFDDYDRLLAWIWVDGQLLNYMLAARGFADVKYLYGDYKYNDDLLDVEYLAQSKNLGIWGDDEPYYNPNDNYSSSSSNAASTDDYISIQKARSMDIGTEVTIQGVVTNVIGSNAFIEDGTAGIYLFTKNRSYSALAVGNKIAITGELADYNSFLELTAFIDNDIKILPNPNNVIPKDISLSEVGESLEGQYIQILNAEITYVDYTEGEKGYSIFIEQNGAAGEIRIDKYLTSYPDPESLTAGDKINVVGNISQHYDAYQIMISNKKSITVK